MTKGEKIKYYRNLRGLTQKQLGEKCGLSEPAIRNYELGNRTPSPQQLEKIAAALNVTVTELILPDLPELLCRLEQLGFKLTMLGGEPIIRVKPNEKKLREILIEYLNKNEK